MGFWYLIYKQITNTPIKNVEYLLTEKGKKFNKVLYEMVIFGLYVLEDDYRTDSLKKQIQTEYEEILNV